MYTNEKGTIVERILNDFNLCIFNSKHEKTFMDGQGRRTTIDLSMSSSSIFSDYSWNVSGDTMGSDHYPIILQCPLPVTTSFKRYKTDMANWDQFRALGEIYLTPERFHAVSDPALAFSSILKSIMDSCMPKSSGKNCKRRLNGWFTNACKIAVKARKNALRRFVREPSTTNLIIYKRKRAEAQKAIRKAKRQSWCAFIDNISHRTSLKTAWSTIQAIQGRKSNCALKFIQTEDGIATTAEEIANALANGLYSKCSGNLYSQAFKDHRTQVESVPIDFSGGTEEAYNDEIKMHELRAALAHTKNSAPGPDGIPYIVLRNLPSTALKSLLVVYNRIFKENSFPSHWKEAHVICLHKAGKDPSQALNYRPISLTNTLCKTMEKIMCERLLFHLESKQLIDGTQSGFRKGRSVTDHHISLETFVRETFLDKNHTIGTFFDMEAAYDRCWKHGVLLNLHDLKIRGCLPIFIENFLSSRVFRVKLGNVLTKKYDQIEGYPQGSLLSILLFIIQMNTLRCELPRNDSNILIMAYVDDLAIIVRSKSRTLAQEKLQKLVNKAHQWASSIGMKFSPGKTVCMHFHQKGSIQPEPELFLDNEKITVVKEVKFLGVTFDRSLMFRQHMEATRIKCLKAMNILKVIAKDGNGVNRQRKLMAYRALIRSKLDFGSHVYASGSKVAKRRLDTIQTQCLRICSGAYRTSPKEGLQVLCREMPIALRQKTLGMKYYLRALSNSGNPAINSGEINKYDLLLEKRHPRNAPFKARMAIHLNRAKVEITNLLRQKHCFSPLFCEQTPPSRRELPEVDLSLASYPKNITPGEFFKNMFADACAKFNDALFVYTDGSKKQYSSLLWFQHSRSLTRFSYFK